MREGEREGERAKRKRAKIIREGKRVRKSKRMRKGRRVRVIGASKERIARKSKRGRG